MKIVTRKVSLIIIWTVRKGQTLLILMQLSMDYITVINR